MARAQHSGVGRNKRSFNAFGELRNLLSNALYNLVNGKYIHDGALAEEIGLLLPQSKLFYDNTSMKTINKIAEGMTINKAKNGAWVLDLGKHFGNRHAYIGYQTIIPNDYNEDGKIGLSDLIKKCPQQVRDMKNSGNNNRNNNNRNNNNNEDSKEQNSSDTELCWICKEPFTVTPPFSRHVCKIKAAFKCSNNKCNGTWSTGHGYLDPYTENAPKEASSFCKKCHGKGRMTSYFLRKDVSQDNSKSGHRKDLCGACILWGDCQALFVQIETIKTAFKDFYNWNINMQVISGESKNKNDYYFQLKFRDYDRKQHYFWVKPYINIV